MTLVAMHPRKMQASNDNCKITLPFCIPTYFHVRDFSILYRILVGSYALISYEGQDDFGNVGSSSQVSLILTRTLSLR